MYISIHKLKNGYVVEIMGEEPVFFPKIDQAKTHVIRYVRNNLVG